MGRFVIEISEVYMNILLAEESSLNGKNAGSKARRDVEYILKRAGFRHIRLYKSNCNKIIVIINILIAYIKVILLSKKINYIVIEHPYIPFKVCEILGKLSKRVGSKGASTILLIHDINSIRYEKQIDIETEIKIINMYKYVIVHNKKMKEFLINNGCKSNIKELVIFDYVLEDSNNYRSIGTDGFTVAVAGNLSIQKSGYIYKLGNINNVKFNLYGNGVDKNILPANVNYCGSFSPKEIPKRLEGSYGLIWDGDEIYSCTGKIGNYLKYNNPHKASLYIVSDKPIITWSKSAIADLVIERNIGICVEKLEDLGNVLSNISQKNYDEMVKNVINMKNDLINGNNLLSVIEDIMDEENEY